MKSLYKKLFALVTRDVSSESESNNLIVLLRIQTITDCVYAWILAGLFFGFIDVLSGVVAIICGLLHLGILWMTYKCNSRKALLYYCVMAAFSTAFYCQYVSGGLGFRYVIFTVIPLIYFKTDESWNFRLSWSLLCAAFSSMLAICGLYSNRTWDLTVGAKGSFILLSTIALAVKLMTISHFYYKKFSMDELKIIRYSQKLEKLATQDPLTKLQNRRGMLDYLSKKVESQGVSEGFSIAMGDIDFFKHINDTYGHEAGDYVLQTVSTVMEGFMEGKGRVARWGGEEFLLIFDMNGDDAFVAVEDLRRKIERTDMCYSNTPLKITMTFGLEEFAPSYEVERSIDKADKKLYQGKEAGRNRVVY